MSSPWSGIEKAQTFERGKFMPGGFRGLLRVKRTIYKRTIRSGEAFIVEFEVVSVDNPGDPESDKYPVEVGEKRTWYQKMVDLNVGLPAVKAWAAAMAGYELHQKDLIEQEVSPHLEDMMEHACQNPADNSFTDLLVYCETAQIETQSGGEFTRYDFHPYDQERHGEFAQSA